MRNDEFLASNFNKILCLITVCSKLLWDFSPIKPILMRLLAEKWANLSQFYLKIIPADVKHHPVQSIKAYKLLSIEPDWVLHKLLSIKHQYRKANNGLHRESEGIIMEIYLIKHLNGLQVGIYLLCTLHFWLCYNWKVTSCIMISCMMEKDV